MVRFPSDQSELKRSSCMHIRQLTEGQTLIHVQHNHMRVHPFKMFQTALHNPNLSETTLCLPPGFSSRLFPFFSLSLSAAASPPSNALFPLSFPPIYSSRPHQVYSFAFFCSRAITDAQRIHRLNLNSIPEEFCRKKNAQLQI